MSAVLVDTHIVAWQLLDSPQLTAGERNRLSRSEGAYSSISLYEIGQKVRLNKWPEIAPFVDRLQEIAQSAGLEPLPITASIAANAAALHWPNRDPFDRLIAATAIEHNLPLLSQDRQFTTLPQLRLA